MKVYTKTGDSGETSLFGGKRVKKYDLRIESYGTVDELNSYIGVIRDHNKDEALEATLVNIQHRLFTIGSELAADPDKKNLQVPQLDNADIEFLENEIDRMTDQLEPMRFFILPGGDLTASHSHVARTICRRAERRVIELNSLEQNVDLLIVQYLNRLSDYLFTLARYFTKQNGGLETPWKTRG
jgi:cob(I)alamin adenosyltransferase